MFDLNLKGISIGRFDSLWNEIYDFKYIKAKITNQKRETMMEIAKGNDLIKFEVILNCVVQILNPYQFMAIIAFKKFILRNTIDRQIFETVLSTQK
jgi:hypothetical protein